MTNIILCGGSGTRLWPISQTLIANWITRKFDLDDQNEDIFLYANLTNRGQIEQSNYPWKIQALEELR